MDFFKYLNRFHLICLYETHIEEGNEKIFQNFFPNFDLHWIFAKRSSVFGRASGGILFAYNLMDIAKCTITVNNYNGLFVIEFKNTIANKMFSIVPLYLRFTNWIEEFEKLKTVLEMGLVYPLIMGDINVRIGNLQSYVDENLLSGSCIYPVRTSKDKVTNDYGKKYVTLLNDYGLVLLNGRTENDLNGEFTYVSPVGKSVNDLTAISNEILPMLSDFKVGCEYWSDHMPLEITFKVSEYQKEEKKTVCGRVKYKSPEMYKSRLERATVAVNVEDVDLHQLTNLVYSAADSNSGTSGPKLFKQKWFNFRCLNLRGKTKKALANWKKCDPTDEMSNELYHQYLLKKRQYLELCGTSKKLYETSVTDQINNITTGKEWWTFVRGFKKANYVLRSNLSSEDFKTYFNALLNPPLISAPFQYADQNITDHNLDGSITLDEIKSVLQKLKRGKSPGEDGITYDCLIDAPENYLQLVVAFFNKLLSSSNIPEEFKRTLLFPLHKKGNPNEVTMYRGIGNMNSLAKFFMGVLYHRLSFWESNNKVLNEYQAGFRPMYSTIDNIYNLFSIVQLKWNQGRKVFGFFVDFKAAFDSIDRNSMFYKLLNMGVSRKFVGILRSLYKGTAANVLFNGELSDEFLMSMGVKQGCLLSPLLFALMLNDLHEALGGGLKIDDMNIRILLYADDIIILADNPYILQRMINRLYDYCKIWNLTVNIQKSQIMIFDGTGRTKPPYKWKFGAVEIEVVKEYKYLGITVTPSLKLNSHLEVKETQGKLMINSTWNEFFGNNSIQFKEKLNLFNACCRSSYTQGAEIWGFDYFEEVDKFQRFFLKKTLSIPAFTPNYIVALELGLPSLHLFTLRIHMNYIMKTLFKYDESRLPNFLSKAILRKGGYWRDAWCHLWPISTDTNWVNCRRTEKVWKSKLSFLLNWLDEHDFEVNIEKARGSTHGLYKELNFYNPLGFTAHPNLKAAEISWIMKARSGLLGLNFSKQSVLANKNCKMCGMEELETVEHFLGRCPSLSQIRTNHLLKTSLSHDEVLLLLNGIFSWRALAKITEDAFKYRRDKIATLQN